MEYGESCFALDKLKTRALTKLQRVQWGSSSKFPLSFTLLRLIEVATFYWIDCVATLSPPVTIYKWSHHSPCIHLSASHCQIKTKKEEQPNYAFHFPYFQLSYIGVYSKNKSFLCWLGPGGGGCAMTHPRGKMFKENSFVCLGKKSLFSQPHPENFYIEYTLYNYNIHTVYRYTNGCQLDCAHPLDRAHTSHHTCVCSGLSPIDN